MSLVFSKNKEKRGRSSTGESNNSFVKNVTSRVSGLLPATITKWFSSPSSSSANGSTPTADATDSSTEDEAPESPVTTQPPAKRMRYSSPGSKFPHNMPETSVGGNLETSETMSTSVLYNTIQPGRNSFRREPNFISTPIRSPNDDTKVERTERDVSYKSPLPVSVLGQSVAPKRKSIFDLKKTESLNACAKTAANTSKDPKQPYFKPSLLGSPFYPGRTMYGGASTSTYINQPNIKQRKLAHVNESKDNETVNMSYSARQVMDLLENFSSPLSEARRIPVLPRKTASNSIDHDRTSVPSPSKNLTYKTQELHVPNIASILRLKQRSRLMDTTKVARQIIASHSSTLSSFQPYATDTTRKEENSDKVVNILEKEPAQSKTTSKLKSRLTRRNRGEENCIENDTETIQLPPTAVLQIDKDNLPKFTFGISSVSTPVTKNQKTTFTQTPTSPEVTFKSLEKPAVNEMFKFSSPVKISLDTHQGDVSFPTFTFGSPERSIDKTDITKKNEPPVIVESKKTDAVVDSGNDWKCSDCWVNNKANTDKCVCCGAKQPMKGTSEKINKVESKPDSNFTPLIKAKEPDSSKWSCPDCWVSNRDIDEKCVCCGSRNPSKSAAATVSKSTESAEKDWKCEDCWISNKSSVDKCAACGGAKAGTKNNASTTSLPLNSVASNAFSKPSNQFNEIIKSQKSGDKWECPTCLVSNTSENTTCVCCGTDKSGGAKETTKQLFNFNTNANTTFKFGIDPKAQEINIQKKSEEAPKPAFTKSVEESETNNNVVPKIPTFTFTLPASKSEDKADASKIETPKPTFTFGIQKPIETSSTVAPFATKPPEPVKPTEEKEDKEKPQEVPKIEFKMPIQEAPKPSTGFFALPSLPSVKPFDQATPTFGSFVNTTSEKKEKESPASILLPTETKVDKSPMTSTFTFSAPGTKPPVNIFAASASTSPPTGITFGTPLQTAPTTTSSPSLSLFQKPETTNAPTLSLFQKNDSVSSTPATAMFQTSGTTTSAPSAPASAAPLFSFGSNTQSAAPAAAPAPEKPSFNFTFGSSASTENQNSVFKPAFSSTTDNSSNKFTLPSAMSNSLGGNNALGTGNLLTGSNLGTNNSMTGNPLSGGNDNNVLGLQAGNGMSATPSVFGSPMQKENMWGSNNTASSNVFGTSGSTNNMLKAAPFTFGSPTPFNSGNSTGGSQPAQGMFGANTQSTQNVFGMPSGNTSQPPMFGSQAATPAQPMFGAQSPAPAIPMFGASPAPAFGAANASTPSFKAPTMSAPSTQAPAFNFGSAPTTGIFGFGQSTPTATPQSTGMYNFGGAASAPGAPGAGAGAPQGLQFNMGSVPNTTMRRMRKAVRRNPQR